MSRSYKKYNWAKCGGDSSYKKIYNRRIRRALKNEDISSGSYYKKLNNSYNIVDYAFDASWEAFREWNWVKDKFFESEEEAYKHWKRYYGSK